MVSTEERIRTTFQRNAKAIALRPAFGQGTAVTKVKLREALICDVEDGPWKLKTDMTEKSGGSNSAPNPGVLGRAALGTCLATGYALWAAHRGVPIDSLEVEIHASYDARGLYGVDGIAPGYTEIRYVVHLESAAPEADVLRVIEEADEHSDYLHVFREPQTVRRQLRIQAKRPTA